MGKDGEDQHGLHTRNLTKLTTWANRDVAMLKCISEIVLAAIVTVAGECFPNDLDVR